MVTMTLSKHSDVEQMHSVFFILVWPVSLRFNANTNRKH